MLPSERFADCLKNSGGSLLDRGRVEQDARGDILDGEPPLSGRAGADPASI